MSGRYDTNSAVVFMMLTSSYRGVDKFLYTMKSLIQSTDLSLFRKKYFLCHNINEEHADAVAYYCARHGFEVLLCQGEILPCLPLNQNVVFARHPGAIFVKCDDDLFFTEGWLPPLLAAYRKHEDTAGLVSSFVPINQACFDLMKPFLQERYGDIFPLYNRPPLISDEEAHYWIWDKVLGDGLVTAFRKNCDNGNEYVLPKDAYLHINCIVYGQKLLDTFKQFPTTYVLRGEGGYFTDEQVVNKMCCKYQFESVVSLDSVVHHHGFHRMGWDFYNKISHEYLWRMLYGEVKSEHV